MSSGKQLLVALATITALSISGGLLLAKLDNRTQPTDEHTIRSPNHSYMYRVMVDTTYKVVCYQSIPYRNADNLSCVYSPEVKQ